VNDVSRSNRLGRRTGVVYLLLIVSGAAGYLTMTSLLAGANPARLADSATAFNAAYAASVIAFLVWVVLALMLHRLIGWAGRSLGLAMIGFTLAGALMNLIALSHLWPLVGSPDAGMDRDTLATLVARYDRTLSSAQVFSGLWMFPFGWLVLRSSVAPRLLGWCLIIGGTAYLFDFLTLLAPGLEDMLAYRIVTTPLALLAMIGELAMCLWLLIKGARTAQPAGS
jgi:hypothetical protein